jgi:hypothetical protein
MPLESAAVIVFALPRIDAHSPPLFLVDAIGVDGARAFGVMLQRNRTLLQLSFSCTQPAFVGASSSLCLDGAPTATCNARDFADCFKTSAEEALLVLDALERNSSLTALNLQGEMGMQATFVQLRGGCRARAAVVVQKQRLRS